MKFDPSRFQAGAGWRSLHLIIRQLGSTPQHLTELARFERPETGGGGRGGGAQRLRESKTSPQQIHLSNRRPQMNGSLRGRRVDFSGGRSHRLAGVARRAKGSIYLNAEVIGRPRRNVRNSKRRALLTSLNLANRADRNWLERLRNTCWCEMLFDKCQIRGWGGVESGREARGGKGRADKSGEGRSFQNPSYLPVDATLFLLPPRLTLCSHVARKVAWTRSLP